MARISSYTTRAVFEANVHGATPSATSTVKRANNAPGRDRVKALVISGAVGYECINHWARANFEHDAALIEAAILKVEIEYPEIDPQDVRKGVTDAPELYIDREF